MDSKILEKIKSKESYSSDLKESFQQLLHDFRHKFGPITLKSAQPFALAQKIQFV